MDGNSIVIGLDLALNKTGYVVMEDDVILDYGIISTPARYPKTESDDAWDTRRLHSIYNHIYDLVGAWEPKVVAIEIPDWIQPIDAWEDDWRAAYARERVVREKLGMARAAAMLAISNAGSDARYIGANEAKSAWGLKSKKDVAAQAVQVWPELTGEPDDVTDAVAVAFALQGILREEGWEEF